MSHTLGAFTLIEPIARGGMGEVWRGLHRRTGRPVAIKVITSEEARSPDALRGFRQEARAAASLDHPHISLVLDYGILPQEVSARALVPGSPYLVTELAEGGDLRGWVARPPVWAALYRALLQLLEALAYAHAHGVVHRDLKPGNVLLGNRLDFDGNSRAGVLLADFGLAFRLDEAPGPGVRARAGTPTYMAPEQARGDWRGIGPWTDLYALGLLVWSLVQGELPPVAERESIELEWLPPRISVPADLPRWISRLIQPNPLDRFPSASAAAAALRALEGEPGAAGWTAGGRVGASALSQDTFLSRSNRTFTVNNPPSAPTLRVSTPPIEPAEPRFPDDWRPSRQGVPMELVDAGLGIFGLRRPQIVGRDDERNALWAALRGVFEGEGASVVLLSGPRGFGKTRLLEWLLGRAEELGVASVALGRGGEGSGGGLHALLLRALRGMDLDERALAEHLARGCGATPPTPWDEAEHLARLLTSSPDELGAQPQTSRLIPALRALQRRARDRLLLIGIDNAADDPDGLELARYLLHRGRSERVLLVLAASDEALADPGEIGAGLCALVDRVLHLPLGPLGVEHWTALARSSLPLTPELSDALASRASGSPLYASLLLDHWVQRGALRVADRGFTLEEGASAELPETVEALVSGQIERLHQERGERDGHALELAATLGLDVDGAEWREVLARAEVRPGDGLLDYLLARRLARPSASPGGWSFAHNMLREAILARVEARDHSITNHMLAAQALATLPPSPDRLGRVGRHWLAAGRPAEAASPLLEAAQGALRAGRYVDLGALLDLVERCLPAVHPEQIDAVSARLWSMRGLLNHFGRSNRPLARQWYAEAERAARRAGLVELAADALRRRGGVTFGMGDRVEAERLLREALAEVADRPASLVHMDTLRDLGTMLRMSGELEEGERAVRASMELAVAVGREDREAMALHILGMIRKNQGDPVGAIALLEQAAEGLRATGDLQQVGSVLNTIGSVQEELGDLDASERSLTRSLQTLSEIGANYEALPRYNLGVQHLQRGRLAEARALLVPGFRRVQVERWPWLLPFYAVAVANVEARLSRWGDCEEALAQLRIHAPDNSDEVRRAARLLAETAALAEGAGHLEIAQEARRWEAHARRAAG